MAKGTRPRVTPLVTPGVAVPNVQLALQDALPGELDIAAAVANPNVADIPLVNPDPQPIAQQPAGNGVDAAFIKVFQYARKCVEFEPTKVSFVFNDVETLTDKASWKTILHFIINRLLTFQGFKFIFNTTGYQFPFDDLVDLTDAQIVRHLEENDALVKMFEERHALEHSSQSIGSTTPMDLPERQLIAGCCEEFCRETFNSDNSKIDDLLLMAENEDQLVYIKRFVNKQYQRKAIHIENYIL